MKFKSFFLSLLVAGITVQASVLDDLKNLKATVAEKTKQIEQAIKGTNRTASNIERLYNTTLSTTSTTKNKAAELKQAEENYQRARILADIFESYVPVLQNAEQTIDQIIEDFVKPFGPQNYDKAKRVSTEFSNAITIYREQIRTLRQVADALEQQIKACEEE